MKIKTGVRAISKKDIVAIMIALVVSVGLWGSGFLTLDQPDLGSGIDRLTYIQAVDRFFAQENLYPDADRALPADLIFFNYSPVSIFTIGFFSLLPPEILYILHFLAVVALFFLWRVIFKKGEIVISIWILPVFLVFSPFIYDAITLNTNVFMALLATVYFFLTLKDGRSARLGAILVLFLLVSIKPQWGIFALLPLVQKRWSFFLQVIAGVVALYLAVLGLAALLTGPEYLMEQHVLFVQHLGTFTQRFTYWNLAPGPYEYNNSIHQVAIYLIGNIETGLFVAGLIQTVLFLVLAAAFAKAVLAKRPDGNSELNAWRDLRWFFIFYCFVLLYPPLNYDFSLGIPLFVFLAAQGRLQKILVGIPLFIVAFQDLIRIMMSFLMISGWFPFIFTTTVIALFFLLDSEFHSAIRQGGDRGNRRQAA